jgi:hypothetical protein
LAPHRLKKLAMAKNNGFPFRLYERARALK